MGLYERPEDIEAGKKVKTLSTVSMPSGQSFGLRFRACTGSRASCYTPEK
jgi:hypothetical protein